MRYTTSATGTRSERSESGLFRTAALLAASLKAVHPRVGPIPCRSFLQLKNSPRILACLSGRVHANPPPLKSSSHGACERENVGAGAPWPDLSREPAPSYGNSSMPVPIWHLQAPPAKTDLQAQGSVRYRRWCMPSQLAKGCMQSSRLGGAVAHFLPSDTCRRAWLHAGISTASLH